MKQAVAFVFFVSMAALEVPGNQVQQLNLESPGTRMVGLEVEAKLSFKGGFYVLWCFYGCGFGWFPDCCCRFCVGFVVGVLALFLVIFCWFWCINWVKGDSPPLKGSHYRFVELFNLPRFFFFAEHCMSKSCTWIDFEARNHFQRTGSLLL